jgi:hypothetical protein
MVKRTKIEDMTMEAIEAESAILTAETTELHKQIEAIQKKFVTVNTRNMALLARKAKLLENDLAYIVNNPMTAYDVWVKKIPKQAASNGYRTDTNQFAFQLKLDYREKANQELLDFIAEYGKVVADCRMGIFRHDLCERGTWMIERRGSEWVIFDARSYEYRYKKQIEHTTKSIEEMLEYVAEKHYYQGMERDEDEDDDY